MSASVRICAGPGFLPLLKILALRVEYLLATGNAQMNCSQQQPAAPQWEILVPVRDYSIDKRSGLGYHLHPSL